MGPYSHIVIAGELEAYLNPDNSREYYWGAVAPDIRYIVPGMPRSKTHISPEKIVNYMVQYPQLKNFLQGYLVHCVSDQLNLPKIINRRSLFVLQKAKLSAPYYTVILEFFNIERAKLIGKTVSGSNNAVLSELGVDDEHAAEFIQSINRYITSSSFSSSISLLRNFGSASDEQMERYRDAAVRFQSNTLQKNLLFLGLQAGRVNRALASSVKSILPGM